MRAFLIALTMLGLTLGHASTAHADAMETDALALINAARAKAGCAALAVNPKLQSAATGHAKAMARQNFFSHTGKNGSTAKSRTHAAGYGWSAIAQNSPAGQSTACPLYPPYPRDQQRGANPPRPLLKPTNPNRPPNAPREHL